MGTRCHRSIATRRPHRGGFAVVPLFSLSLISAKMTCETFDIAAKTGGVRSENNTRKEHPMTTFHQNRLSLNTVTMWTSWP